MSFFMFFFCHFGIHFSKILIVIMATHYVRVVVFSFTYGKKNFKYMCEFCWFFYLFVFLSFFFFFIKLVYRRDWQESIPLCEDFRLVHFVWGVLCIQSVWRNSLINFVFKFCFCCFVCASISSNIYIQVEENVRF